LGVSLSAAVLARLLFAFFFFFFVAVGFLAGARFRFDCALFVFLEESPALRASTDEGATLATTKMASPAANA
jgi:hypothetical protein